MKPYDLGTCVIIIDPSKMRHIAITCRCGCRWTEYVPAEVHDSWLCVAFTCGGCGATFVLQNKKLERLTDAESKRLDWNSTGAPDKDGKWTQSGGNA